MPSKPAVIVFLGDSITAGYDWATLFKNSHIRNHGVGGDTSDGVLRRLDPIVERKPEQIFLMVGINDLWNGVSVDEITANHRHILERCKNKSPGTTLVMQSVLPMNGSWSSTPERIPVVNKQVGALNSALKLLAAEFGFPYIDLHSLFLKERELDPQYTYDGLHLNEKAYLKWKSSLEPFLKRNQT